MAVWSMVRVGAKVQRGVRLYSAAGRNAVRERIGCTNKRSMKLYSMQGFAE